MTNANLEALYAGSLRVKIAYAGNVQNLYSMQCIEENRYYIVKYLYFQLFLCFKTHKEIRLSINIEHWNQQCGL